MQYRQFGKLNIQVSALGFGCMRLPTLKGKSAVDTEAATAMLRYAIDNGVNYIDTAWPYHKETSETVVGQALRDGYRERVYLATKSPVFRITQRAEFDYYLDRQLEKLQTNYIDFYLLHALTGKRWQQSLKNGVIPFLERAKSAGKIRHIGFSFHDELAAFKEIVDAYDWEFCQIQYNYMNEQYQAGRDGLQYAAAKGLAVIIMEPLLGGRLAQVGDPALTAIWHEAAIQLSPVGWALNWLWNQPEVSLVLSGMSSMEQVVENVALASKSVPFKAAELIVVDKVRRYYLERTKADCTGCGYCSDCPAGIKIAEVFELYNHAYMYGEHEEAKNAYRRMANEGKDFSHCLDCSQCEQVCPQHLNVRSLLRDFDREYLNK